MSRGLTITGAGPSSTSQRRVGVQAVPQNSPPTPQNTPTRRGLLLSGLAASVVPLLLSARPAEATVLLDSAEAESVSRVFSDAQASVVSIIDEVRDSRGTGRTDDEVTGSGFVWSTDGYIVTTYRAVARLARDASSDQVTKVQLFDREGKKAGRYRCSLVASSAAFDLAVLQIQPDDKSELVPVRLSDGSDTRAGQTAIAVGCSRGAPAVSLGVVSGLRRTIPAPTGQRMAGVLQTDAIITPEFGGGGLFDSSGRLIAMNLVTKRDAAGPIARVNFALPSDLLLTFVPRLIVCKTTSSKCA